MRTSSDHFTAPPVTHKIYGVPQTINTANYVYFLAYQELFALRGTGPSEPPQRPLDALVTGVLNVLFETP